MTLKRFTHKITRCTHVKIAMSRLSRSTLPSRRYPAVNVGTSQENLGQTLPSDAIVAFLQLSVVPKRERTL